MFFQILIFLFTITVSSSSLAKVKTTKSKNTASSTKITYCTSLKETQCYTLDYKSPNSAIYESKILSERIRLGVKGADLKKLEVVFLSLTEVFQAEKLRQESQSIDLESCAVQKQLRLVSPESRSVFRICWQDAGSSVRKQIQGLRQQLETLAVQKTKKD